MTNRLGCEHHALTVRGWLVRLALDDECGAYQFNTWDMTLARRVIVGTFLRPISYFGADPHLEISVRSREWKAMQAGRL